MLLGVGASPPPDPRRTLTTYLTAGDLEHAGRAIELLLKPLDWASPDRWRSEVNRSLGSLLGADSAGFLLPGVDGPFVYSDEHDPTELAKYPDLLPPPLPDGRMIFERGIELGVSTLPQLWGDVYPAYLKSEYHNDFAVANGADDALTALIAVDGDDPLPFGGLQFWHVNPRRRRFEQRETALVRLVLPALKAGVETQLRYGRHRAGLLGALDGLDMSTAVFDGTGHLLHLTPTLSSALHQDPESALLEGAMGRVATVLGRRATARGGSGPIPAPASATVRTNLATYRVTASLYRSPLPRSASLVLVALKRTTPILRSEQELRRLYGLTHAENRVAVHLVSSRTSAEIARELCVSTHTVRRHTEKILAKTQVRSRAELALKVLR